MKAGLVRSSALAGYLLLCGFTKALAGAHYVDVNSTNPVPPFSNWSTASVDIQSAIDDSIDGDVILVTDGVYQTGGRAVGPYALTNRVVINKGVTVQSVNGATATIIQGYQIPLITNGDSAVRCVYMTNHATLIGFTLRGGATRVSGDSQHEWCAGGVWCESTNDTLVFNCVLENNAALGDGGAAVRGSFSNCTFRSNFVEPNRGGGGALYSVLNNCLLTGNSAYAGGGAGLATLNGCVLEANFATLDGGGALSCTLSNCVLRANLTGDGGWGGAAANSTLRNCLVVSNFASGMFGYGGGVYQSTLYNCTLQGNWGGQYGGAAYYCTLNNCVVAGNTARYGSGGGTYYGTLNNCTVTGNWARDSGGGSYFSMLNNCIVYYNVSARDQNYYRSNLVSYCCTSPNPGGLGNIGSEPLLASNSHLSLDSPCRGAGNSTLATGFDIDGDAWINPPSIGADEFRTNTDSGPLSVSVQTTWTNAIVGYAIPFTAMIEGRSSNSRWSFGDGTVVSNHPYASHAWQVVGSYPVILTAFNQSNPGGVSTTTTVQIATSLDFYVAANTTNPVPPYRDWATAAREIQDAVDVAAQFAGATVWVADGTYSAGGRVNFGTLSNRVAITTPITVRSLNGPSVTTIQGNTASDDAVVRCAYLTNGASLVGFTLTNGSSQINTGDTIYTASGGAVWGEDTTATVSNCVIVGNTAYHGGGARGLTLNNCILSNNLAYGIGVVGFGGGAAYCNLNNCILTRNSAGGAGAAEMCNLNGCILSSNSATSIYAEAGGAEYGALNNCVITGNSTAGGGGGAYYAFLNNCIVTDNSAQGRGGGAVSGTLTNCTVVGNSDTAYGGGLYGATARNCIIYYNTAPNGSNCYATTTMSFCCTTPGLAGSGNITNAPGFVNLAARDLRLAFDSPCINSGNNAFVSGSTDLDGNPRIKGSTVDVGAYEYQNPASVISYSWLLQYSLPLDGSLDFADSDRDGMDNWQEWIAGTSPVDQLSLLAMYSPAHTNNPAGLAVTWQSVTNRTYFLQRSLTISAAPAFSTIKSNIVGRSVSTTFTDTNAIGAGPYFYRVGIQQ